MMYACVRTTEPQSLQRGERTVVAADEAGPPPPPPSAVQTASATWSRGRCWWPAPPAQQTIKPLSLFPSTAVQSAPQHCLGQCHSVSHSTARASATLSPATLPGPVPLCLPQHCPGQCHSVSRNTVRSSVMSVSCNTVWSSVMSVSCNIVRSSATLSHATLSGPVPLCLMQHCQLKTVRFSTSVVTALCFAPSPRQLWPVCFVSHHSPRAVVMYTYVLLFSLTGKSVHPPLCRRYGPTRFRSDHHVVL